MFLPYEVILWIYFSLFLQKLEIEAKTVKPKGPNTSINDDSNDVIFVDDPPKRDEKQNRTTFTNAIKEKSKEKKTEDSTTPPLPSDPVQKSKEKSMYANSVDEIETKQTTDAAEVTTTITTTVAAPAPKRSEWDMFAEQDVDSNFDVSDFHCLNNINNLHVVFFFFSNYRVQVL